MQECMAEGECMDAGAHNRGCECMDAGAYGKELSRIFPLEEETNTHVQALECGTG